METLQLSADAADLDKAAAWIKNGEVVGMPTETVYGLAADACNPEAVAKVFAAKGRPADNPLIVHIADMDMLPELVCEIPPLAYRLAETFWPGPLTMIFKKQDCIPAITSGGLNTVGIRMPAHPAALELIRLAGVPIAAPSGNVSGYPSPTTAAHMVRDMSGKIAAIVDGGDCTVGVESTVISFEDENTVRILRPGGVTQEQLLTIAEHVVIDPAILHELQEGQSVRSPGMKYQHYSPAAHVVLAEGDYAGFCSYVNSHAGNNTYALVFDGEGEGLSVPAMTFGKDDRQQAQQLFAALRELDERGACNVFVRAPEPSGIGLAVYNRLIRAAGFEVIQV
ncbi:MAG: threonylcarbamoyl-AMP synthase [Ruminococcus sp.]|nr:threonylcarbamoyl-AMP synthase [Ruminococcus sp.]